MADEKKQLILDLLARNKMTGGTQGAARDIDRVGTAADAATKKTDRLGKAADAAGRATDDLGDEAAQAAGKIDRLDSQIRKLDQDLILMAGSLAEAGSKAEKLDISKGIRRAQAEIRQLQGSKNILQRLLPDPDPAQAVGWAKKLQGSLTSALASAGPMPLAGGIIGAAIGPTVAASIAGAVVGGVGAGGIIGGAALAVKASPEIQGYGKAIGQSFMAGVTKEAQQAFTAPIQAQMGKLEALSARSVTKIGKIFDNTAPSVGKFTDAVVRSGDAILDSFVRASAKSGPALDALGGIVETVSNKTADFIDMLSEHGDSGADALEEIGTAAGHAMDAVSLAVESLINFKEGLDKVDDAIDTGRGFLEDHVTKLDLTADGYAKGSEAAQLYRDGVIGAAGSVNDYNAYLAGAVDSTGKLAEQHTNAEKAALGQRDALDELSKELRAQTDPAFALLNATDKVKDAQERSAEAIKKHGKNSQEARAATRDLALAALDLQGKAGELGTKFSGTLTPAMRQTLQAANLTEKEIAQVEAEMRRAKKAGDQYAKNYVASVGVRGAAAARNALYSVKDIVDDIPRAVTIAMRITGVSNVSAARAAVRKNIDARASGGPISRGMPYLVGEHGPELVVPAAAGRVMSAAATRGAMQSTSVRSAPAGFSGPVTARLELVGPEYMRVMFRKMIRELNILPGYSLPGGTS
jgi:hypothetical protein